MILRNVSSLTSSEPFSRPDLSSDTDGYSAPESVTTVWHDGSEEDIIGAAACDEQRLKSWENLNATCISNGE